MRTNRKLFAISRGGDARTVMEGRGGVHCEICVTSAGPRVLAVM
jgi:hypothetical protein